MIGAAGTGNAVAPDYSVADGVGAAIRMRSMTAMTIDSVGAMLYVYDERTIRRVNLTSLEMKTMAGTFDIASGGEFAVRLDLINTRILTWPMVRKQRGSGRGRCARHPHKPFFSCSCRS
jgi:hypothetical protein